MWLENFSKKLDSRWKSIRDIIRKLQKWINIKRLKNRRFRKNNKRIIAMKIY